MPASCPHCGAVLIPGQPVCTECGKRASGPPPGGGGPARPGAASRPEAAGGPGAVAPRAVRDKQKDFLLVGKVIADKYKVLEVLGQGGFGTVYLVEIVAGMVGERLALKILPEELSSQPAFRSQFLNEIRIAMRVIDKYIVQIRDVGTTEEGLLYYTMDFCPGTTLAHVLRQEGRLSITRAILIALNVLRGLQTAHAAGVVHRDLKPANIMVQVQGGKDNVRVLDFGIATAIIPGAEREKGFVGSPHYMPPEQFVGEEVGFYTDLYSIGVILYECITGQKPYQGTSAQEVFKNLKNRIPAPPETLVHEVGKFPGLPELMLKAIEKNPEKRFQSARELFDALNAVLARTTGPPPAPAAPPPAQPAATPQLRIHPDLVRRRRVISRRRGTNAGAVAAATIILGSVILGVIFHKEIERLWHNLATVRPPPPGPAAARREAAPADAPGADITTRRPPEAVAAKTTRDRPGSDLPLEEQKAVAKAALLSRTRRLLDDGSSALATGDWGAALEHAEKLLALDPQSADALRLKGLAELGRADFAEAAALLEKARSLTKPSEVDPELLRGLAEAKLGLAPPAAAEAESLLREALRLEPKFPKTVLLLARALEKARKSDELRKLLAEAKAEGIDSPELSALHVQYSEEEMRRRSKEAGDLAAAAREALEKGDIAKAEELAGRSRAMQPVEAADIVLIDAAIARGDLDRALLLAEAALKPRGAGRPDPGGAVAARKDYLSATMAIASADDATGEPSLKAAEASLRAAIGKLEKSDDPADSRLHTLVRLALARTHALRGSADEVSEALKPLARDPTPAVVVDEARVYLVLARKSAVKGAKAQAYGQVKRLLQGVLKSKDLKAELRRDANYLIGVANLESGDLEKSEASYRQALTGFAAAHEAGLATAELFEGWAAAYDRTGNLIGAAQRFRSVYDLHPTPSNCLRAVEYYLNANPRSQEALEILKEATGRFQDNKEIQAKYRELTK